jgi:glucose-6-phosphate dehydrogenase assembly protein OpcA
MNDADLLAGYLGIPVKLRDVERELARQLHGAEEGDSGPIQWVRMSNLVVYCTSMEAAAELSEQVPDVVAVHPARVLLLIGEAGSTDVEIRAYAQARCRSLGKNQHACSEQVALRAAPGLIERLPFVVRALLVGDLPTNLWWATNTPPALAGPLLAELAEGAQQIIYDSLGWPDPARGVASTAAWIEQVERRDVTGHWRVASDLNWRRLKYWRRLTTQALDPKSAPGAAESVSEILIEHGPHAVIQAWELASWLTIRLGWRLQGGKVQPGTEIAWRFTAPKGEGRVRIRRLEQGPPEIRTVRIACTLEGKPVAIKMTTEGPQRLATFLEGVDAAPRTQTLPPLSPAELVGKQLSDRERDPVFRESMAVAQVLAQSLLK